MQSSVAHSQAIISTFVKVARVLFTSSTRSLISRKSASLSPTRETRSPSLTPALRGLIEFRDDLRRIADLLDDGIAVELVDDPTPAECVHFVAASVDEEDRTHSNSFVFAEAE